jgi:hypothetical protein
MPVRKTQVARISDISRAIDVSVVPRKRRLHANMYQIRSMYVQFAIWPVSAATVGYG